MNPEIIIRLMLLMAGLTNPRNAEGRKRFAYAIAYTTPDPAEQRLLAVVAYGENWYHLTSYPPFGLTNLLQTNPRWCWGYESMPEHRRTWGRPRCETLTIELAAPRALMQLRFIRRNRCGPGATDADVLAWYGWGGRCVANPITTDRMDRAYRLTRHWR